MSHGEDLLHWVHFANLTCCAFFVLSCICTALTWLLLDLLTPAILPGSEFLLPDAADAQMPAVTVDQP